MASRGLNGKVLDDDALAAFLAQRVRTSVGFADSRLSREREEVGRYYDATEPKPLHLGNSKYVSQTVYDSVEMMKATILETFTGNSKPVRFSPSGQQDVQLAKIATDYCDYVIFRENDGFAIMQDIIHDGLLNRFGIAHPYWKDDKEEITETVASTTHDALALLLGNDKVKDLEVEDNDDGTIKVTYTRVVDRSRVVIDTVPSEEFGISPRAKDIASAEIVYRRTKKTYSQLLKEGYPKKILDEINQDDKVWLDTEPEVVQRFEQVDDASYLGLDDEMQKATRHIVVYEVYCDYDPDDSGKSYLYKAIFAGDRVLHKEQVSCKPFIPFVPLPRPHSFWGNSFAKRLIPTQNARTLLTRSIIDSALITTNPRWQIVRGGLVNAKEMLENRIGGLVNVTRPDAIAPLPYASLNPFVFNTIQMLDEDTEEATGISKLSQGLNKDAISHQNSAEMVQSMVQISQTRQKIIARNFARFLRELFLRTYQLVIENEKQAKIVQITGDWVQINPEDWQERKDVEVEFYIGYGEGEKEAGNLLQMDQYFSSQPGLQPGYGYAQRYALLQKAAEAKGIKGFAAYLLPPDKLPPQQPNPAAMQQMQLAERDMKVKEGHLQLAAQKAQLDGQRKQTETVLKAEREGLKDNMDRGRLALDRDKFEHDMTVDAAEIALQRKAQTIQATPRPVG